MNGRTAVLIFLSSLLLLIIIFYTLTLSDSTKDENEDDNDDGSKYQDPYFLNVTVDEESASYSFNVDSSPEETFGLEELRIHLEYYSNMTNGAGQVLITALYDPYYLSQLTSPVEFPFEYAITYGNGTPMEPYHDLVLVLQVIDGDSDGILSEGDHIDISVTEDGEPFHLHLRDLRIYEDEAGVIAYYGFTIPNDDTDSQVASPRPSS